MSTALLSKEQVDQLTYKECKTALKLLCKEYRMDTPWTQLTKEERKLSDEIGNTLLWLEDRIYRFEDSRVPSMDPNATIVAPPKKESDPSKAKRKARRFIMQGVVYENVHEAARKTGIKVGTLQTYVRRKPDQYGYIDD